MSIAKPTLSDIWANAAPAGDTGIADPGGLKDTGWTAASACPPFSWFNWILNKCDAVGRYLEARGIPDWDAAESYSIGDRVQGSDGSTYVATTISGPPGTGENPGTGGRTKWAKWGTGIPDYRSDGTYYLNDVVFAPSDGASYVCILANGPGSPQEPHASPTYWTHWGHRDADIANLISFYDSTTIGTSPTGISMTDGILSNVVDLRVGVATVFRDLSFTIDNIPASPGYVDVTLASPIAFGSAIKNVQVTGVYVPTATWDTRGMLLGANSVRIFSNNLYGPMATAYVRLCGY